MDFKKYQHIERFGNDEVEGITDGVCYIFPKLDGTNSSVWISDGEIKAGSRNRELTEEQDNADFLKTIKKDERIISYLKENPTHRLFGEWLVPHSLKTYRNEAWNNFYIFDVCVSSFFGNELNYKKYDIYAPLLEKHGLEYITPMCILENPPPQKLYEYLEKNTYLIQDGNGCGEGIVIKNYEYTNKFGRTVWAKIVTDEFREKNKKQFGVTKISYNFTEREISEKYITNALVEKEFSKIKNEHGEWENKYIPRLFSAVYHSFITDDLWGCLKKFKNPKIDFKILNSEVTRRIKSLKEDIFKER